MIIINKQCNNKFWWGWRKEHKKFINNIMKISCYPSTTLNECYNVIIISDFSVSKICPCSIKVWINCWHYSVTEHISICFSRNTDILLFLFPITICEVFQFQELRASRFMSLFFSYPKTERTTKSYKKS